MDLVTGDFGCQEERTASPGVMRRQTVRQNLLCDDTSGRKSLIMMWQTTLRKQPHSPYPTSIGPSWNWGCFQLELSYPA